MASLLSPRRTIAGLSLRAKRRPQQPDTPDDRAPVRRSAGGRCSRWRAGRALAGWVLCAGLAVIGWLAADPARWATPRVGNGYG